MNISSIAQDRKHWRILQAEIGAADKSTTWYLFTQVITLLQIGKRRAFVKVPERDMANLLLVTIPAGKRTPQFICSPKSPQRRRDCSLQCHTHHGQTDHSELFLDCVLEGDTKIKPNKPPTRFPNR